MNKPAYFAIYIDDMERASSFYSKLFGWEFSAYGPAEFLQIKTNEKDGAELIGALQSRKYSPVKEKVIGFECTIRVENIDEVIEGINSNGGQIVLPKTEIPKVGWVAKFLDTEGNLVCVMEYHQ